MLWILGSIVEGLVFAAVARAVRRKYDDDGLIMLAAGSAIILSIVNTFVPPFSTDFREFTRQGVIGAILGVIVSSLVINRLVVKNPAPDPSKELGWGAFAFAVAFFFGVGIAGLTGVHVG